MTKLVKTTKNKKYKLKTNKSAAKRFSIKGSEVSYKHAGKRHNMRRKSQKQIRNLRAAGILDHSFAKNVIKNLLPNG